MSETKVYQSYQRANLAYRWCFPDVGFMPIPYDTDDDPVACELAVQQTLATIMNANRAHPIKRKYKTLDRITQAFDKKYPLAINNH